MVRQMKPLSQMREGHAVVSEEEERLFLAVETIVDKDSPIALGPLLSLNTTSR
jgi:hypothetical protein